MYSFNSPKSFREICSKTYFLSYKTLFPSGPEFGYLAIKRYEQRMMLLLLLQAWFMNKQMSAIKRTMNDETDWKSKITEMTYVPS